MAAGLAISPGVLLELRKFVSKRARAETDEINRCLVVGFQNRYVVIWSSIRGCASDPPHLLNHAASRVLPLFDFRWDWQTD